MLIVECAALQRGGGLPDQGAEQGGGEEEGAGAGGAEARGGAWLRWTSAVGVNIPAVQTTIPKESCAKD